MPDFGLRPLSLSLDVRGGVIALISEVVIPWRRRHACHDALIQMSDVKSPRKGNDLRVRRTEVTLSCPDRNQRQNFPPSSPLATCLSTFRENKCPLSRRPGRASATRNLSHNAVLASHLLDALSRLASTAVSRGPSWPCSLLEQKASQSLPALEVPILNRNCCRSRSGSVEVVRSACPRGFTSRRR